MSKAFLSVEGFIAEPQSTVTQSGKPVLNISVAHQPRKFDKQANQWVDAGDTLWVRAAFFGDEAEFLQTQLEKGSLVRLEGEPEMQSYTTQSGEQRTSLQIKFANVLIVPRKRRNEGGQQSQQGWGDAQQPAGASNNSPWGDSPTESNFGSPRPF